MTKKWTALLLAAVLAVGLSACDTSRAEAPGSGSTGAGLPYLHRRLPSVALHAGGRCAGCSAAVRFVRQNADVYGIDPDDIAVMGFSAGGIQAGEFLMHYDEDVNGTALDESYVPDALDAVPAHASAAGMIYSFYGRLSVGNMDPDWLAEGDLPPTFYVYGTEDPFYRQFQQQYDVIRNMGISTGRIVLNGWPHGFGSDGGWVNDYAAWLESVFANKEEF